MELFSVLFVAFADFYIRNLEQQSVEALHRKIFRILDGVAHLVEY